MSTASDDKAVNPTLLMLKANKESGYNYRERRQEDWKENYTLFRDKVVINRLTQRQSVNLPLMKTVWRAYSKDIDDMPVIYFENLDNNKQKEVFQNEHWRYTIEVCNKGEILDMIDKKQEFMFGRTFDQWQIVDGKVKFNIIDPEDISVDRFMNPDDLNSSRFLIHSHIFVPLAILKANKDYDSSEVKNLEDFFTTDKGIVTNEDNKNSLTEKNRRMSEMGLDDVDDPIVGETVVELTMHFVYHKEKPDEEEQIYLFVEAEDMCILMKKPLEEVIGVTKDHWWRNHYPYHSWAHEIDKQDFWTDGIADMVRTPNKVLNSWFSQMVENRTLRNFGMNYYNSSLEGFNPQTFQAVPWGWYPLPVPSGGKIQDVIQRVEIPDLSESMDEMNYVVSMTEKATGATPTQQGVTDERKLTLGEIELALGEAKESTKGTSKYYTQVWKERGQTYLKLLEAAPDKLDIAKISKKGINTNNVYTRDIGPKDYSTPQGYDTKVWSQDEKDAKDQQGIEKLNAVKANIPNNPKLDEVFQRKLLEFADLKPEEVNEIMKIEEEKRLMMMNNNMGQPLLNAPVINGVPTPPAPGAQPPGPVMK